MLLCLVAYSSNGQNSTNCQLKLRGEPKSSTTYVEYFVRSLLVNYFNLAGVDYTLHGRTISSTTGTNAYENLQSFSEVGKHCILHANYRYFSGSPRFIEKCSGVTSVDDLRKCIRPDTEAYMKVLDTNVKFLLVLREPLQVVASSYYHVTPLREASQRSLDEFAMNNSENIFKNVASRYLIHNEFLRNVSLVWYHDAPVEQNAKPILSCFGIYDESFSKLLVDVATILSSKDSMGSLERLRVLPLGGAKHGKVATGEYFDISPNVSMRIIERYKGLFPKKLRERWYAHGRT